MIHAAIEYDTTGVPWSPQFQDVYHSADGGLEQARHVFLLGNDLPNRWNSIVKNYGILETGFGLGVNFFTTIDAWLDSQSYQAGKILQFNSIEKFPPYPVDIQKVWQLMISKLAVSRQKQMHEILDQLHGNWPTNSGHYELEFSNAQVTLRLIIRDIEAGLDQLQSMLPSNHLTDKKLFLDAVYLDGFNPAKNPQMWTSEVFRSIAHLSGSQTTLATWAVSRRVKDGLIEQGFAVQKLPGFSHKREMLSGRYVVPA